MIVTLQPRARRRLRGLGSVVMPLALAQPYSPAPPQDATDCSTWDFFFDPAAWKACAAAAEVSSIQSVAKNAAQYYGADSVTAQVAQTAANQQSAFANSDVQNVATFFNAGQLVSAASVPAWIWALAIGGGALVLVSLLRR